MVILTSGVDDGGDDDDCDGDVDPEPWTLDLACAQKKRTASTRVRARVCMHVCAAWRGVARQHAQSA